MVGAIRLQERVVAAIAALTLVLVGLLGRGHAADVAHAVDTEGRLVHAEADDGALAAHDRNTQATHFHEHAPGAHADSGACLLVAVAHQVAITTPHSVVHAFTCEDQVVSIAPSAPARAFAQYRLAPKTSPPLAG